MSSRASSASRMSGRVTGPTLRLRGHLLRPALLRPALLRPALLRAPLLRPALLGHGARRVRRGRALLARVAARLHDVALAAVGAALPLLLELLHEGLKRLLL